MPQIDFEKTAHKQTKLIGKLFAFGLSVRIYIAKFRLVK
jgi:hypothetical protein